VSQTPGGEMVAVGTLPGATAHGGVDRTSENTPPFPQQTPVLGLLLETRDSGEYCVVNGQVERRKRPVLVRGLNWNHNHELKNLFKGAATTASAGSGVFQQFYLGLLNKGMQPEMARLTLARKIAAITLKIWKKGEAFNPEHLKSQAA